MASTPVFCFCKWRWNALWIKLKTSPWKWSWGEINSLYDKAVLLSHLFMNDLGIVGKCEASVNRLDLTVKIAAPDGSRASVGGVAYLPSHVAALLKYGTDTLKGLANMTIHRTRAEGRKTITNLATVTINRSLSRSSDPGDHFRRRQQASLPRLPQSPPLGPDLGPKAQPPAHESP
jgi:hypothetical protein